MFFPNIFVSCQLSSHFLISLSIGSILYNFEPDFFHPPYLQIYVILWLENLNCWLNINIYNLNWLVWLALIMTGDTNLNYIPVVIFYPMLYFCNCQVFLTDFQRNHLIECYFKHLFIRFHCLVFVSLSSIITLVFPSSNDKVQRDEMRCRSNNFRYLVWHT